MQDYHRKHFPRLPRYHQTVEGIKTLFAFSIVIICFSLMGWCCIPEKSPNPTISLQDVPRLTAAEMARITAEYNLKMEKRAKEGK